MSLLNNVTSFIEFLNKFRDIDRRFYATGLSRMENDVEHSYQLAMIAWFLLAKENTTLDINKVIKYALVHDLVETFAGDTPFMSKAHDTKQQREHNALVNIKKLFGTNFIELYETIVAYESRQDKESLFVNALDKTIPMINGYMDNGRTWHKLYSKMDLDEAISIKRDAAKQDSIINRLSNQVLDALLMEKERFFGNGFIKDNNYAFIDGQNLYRAVRDFDWDFDYARFRIHLKETYNVTKAIIFLGYIKDNERLYKDLRGAGFEIQFKNVSYNHNGKTKGNVDVFLTTYALSVSCEYDKAVLVTSDGDFAELVSELLNRDKLRMVLSPHKKTCSWLLRKAARGKIRYLYENKKKLRQVKRHA